MQERDGQIQGRRLSVQPELLASLMRGDWPVGDRLDLHRLTVDDARLAVSRFLAEAVQRRRRVVLIVTGKGRHSPARYGVLRSEISDWLTTDRSCRSVLCFASARPEDGGVGALYVLLEKRRP